MTAQLVDNYLPTVQNGPGGQEISDYSGGALSEVHNAVQQRESQYGGKNWLRMRRPYLDSWGRPTISLNRGRWTKQDSRGGEARPLIEGVLVRDLLNQGVQLPPVVNATSLRKEEWLELDRVVLRAARYRLLAWADLVQHNSFGGFNAMAKMILEHETMSDPGEASVDMDGLTEAFSDAPKFQLEGLPLPITHADFWFSARKLATSRSTGTPLDSTLGESSGRRVAETIEKTTIGIVTGVTYGGNSTQVGGYGRTSSVYGYTNFSSRLTKTNITAPTATAWTPETTLNEVLASIQLLRNNKFYGPYLMYHTNDWDTYLDGDYYVVKTSGAVAPTTTLRNRLKQIVGLEDCKRLDMWFGSQPSSTKGPGYEVDATLKAYSFLLVQMTPDVARGVNGMDITTLQWESVGGMRLNFKVMCIQVPQLRADFYGNCGIIHCTTS